MAYTTVILNPGAGGNSIAVDNIGGADYQRVKIATGAEGAATDVSAANPMPVSQASQPLPTGAATEAGQIVGNLSLSDINGKLPASLGQKVAAASMAVVLPSDGTLPLPTGAATAALQGTGNTALSNIDGKLPATLGQKTGAQSLAVVMASDVGVLTMPAPSALDAFSRARVSEPNILFSGVADYVRGGGGVLYALRYTGTTANGGTNVEQTNNSSRLLSTDGTNGSLAIYQTKEYFLYRAAQSHLVFLTFVLQTGGNNVRRRVGYFDANDGIFLQRDTTGVFRITLRTSTSGAPVDTNTVEQANWNQDPLNGTGPSGVTLNFNNRQIMVLDLQFLGVGQVRVGFDVGGEIIWAHWFANANAGAGAGVYMVSATLPVRWEIENTSAGTAGSLEAICAGVHREGDAEEPGITTPIFNEANVTISTTWTVVLVARLKSSAIRASLRDFEAAVLNNDNTISAEFGVILNPTFSGARTWRNITAQAREIAEMHDGSAAALTITNPTPAGGGNGTWLISGFAPAGNRGGSGTAIPLKRLDLPVVADYAGTSDEVALVARSFSGSVTCRGALHFRELF